MTGAGDRDEDRVTVDDAGKDDAAQVRAIDDVNRNASPSGGNRDGFCLDFTDLCFTDLGFIFAGVSDNDKRDLCEVEGREPAVEAAMDMIIEEIVDRTTASW